MLQIRNSVFETNSSSSHSIVVKRTGSALDKVDPGWHMQDGIIKFWNEDNLDFERWPFDVLADWHGRLRYAIASFEGSNIEDIKYLCEKHIEGFKDFKFPEDPYEKNALYYGHVDYQSFGLLQRFLETNNVSLEDFLFNDRYVVIIDGDEYEVFDRMMEKGLIDKTEVEQEFGIYDE